MPMIQERETRFCPLFRRFKILVFSSDFVGFNIGTDGMGSSEKIRCIEWAFPRLGTAWNLKVLHEI